ncbi:zinc transporter ZIP11 isoform X2 [Hydra vulgaris]|uniref:Zinc transporter ZIP11 n=1 Tax=Hydra vulgaris TaxID=6087 RepID=A0ABM4CD21_HYDVU
MIRGQNKVFQAFLGTLMTWGLTAAGSSLVFFFGTRNFKGKRKILDGSLGFAAGVMTAASYWSLLAPAIEMAVKSGYYGSEGQYAFGPVALGFLLGGVFVLLSDMCLPHFSKKDPAIALAIHSRNNESEVSDQNFSSASAVDINDSVDKEKTISDIDNNQPSSESIIENLDGDQNLVLKDSVKLRFRNIKDSKSQHQPQVVLEYKIERKNKLDEEREKAEAKFKSWTRILLLCIAITIHNIPEGLAVGVAFGAIGTSDSATFDSARNLAIGIGIQNFPEGMAVSVPLCAAGYSPFKSFLYGQLSGMVEPIFGVLGAVAVVIANPLLPYALAFAAGAMIYVVVNDIIPEANICGNGRVASWGCMLGFVVMMCLDVGLG